MNAFGTAADKEHLPIWQRGMESVSIVLMVGLFGFMVYHQQTNSGFFTERFDTLEMACLYVPMALAVSALALMRQHSITQLLVVDAGRYIGIVHLHDLVREGIV